MLDRGRVLSALTKLETRLFADLGYDHSNLKMLWEHLVSDPTFLERAAKAHERFHVPKALDCLAFSKSIRPESGPYTLLSVDGSQIYPDRHMPGGMCFLINVGGITLHYDKQSSASFFCEPTVLLPQDVIKYDAEGSFSQDWVDLVREAYELRACARQASKLMQQGYEPFCLFDGSLIFFHLDLKAPAVRARFLRAYMKYLEELYQNRVVMAGYISMPKGRDLVSYLDFEIASRSEIDWAELPECQALSEKDLEHIVDSNIASWFLQPGQRTGLFASSSPVCDEYPAHLKPYFCYLHVGDEIGRVEVPAWMVEESGLVDDICRVLLDQCHKGRGYPIALAEAHEQAVVKGADRDFFYHLIAKMGIEQKKRLVVSQKSLKKRGIGI